MQIILTEEESLSFFYRSLCNGLSTLCQSNLAIDYDAKEYEIAKSKKPHMDKRDADSEVICYEDVLCQILLDGGKLTAIDEGYNGEHTKSITIRDVYDRVSKTPIKWLLQMENEEDDAITADCILQTVFFEDIIFG